MPYKLLLSEEISPAIRRMALEQLKRARRSLSSTDDMQVGVLQARKSFKKLRALVLLAEPILGIKVFKSENRLYRRLGRLLEAPRSAGAHIETLTKFERRTDMKSLTPLFTALRGITMLEKQRKERELEIVALGKIMAELDGAISHWSERSLAPATFEMLAHGFANGYETGRASLEYALKKGNSFYLHEWRKNLQRTWRHMQILTLIWPEDIMPRIRLAREISLLLGTEHDISELILYIKLHKSELYEVAQMKPLMKAFRAEAKAAQRELSLHAIERGRRLYAFDAPAIEQAMVTYWQTAKAMQPLPSVALELAEIIPFKGKVNTEHRSGALAKVRPLPERRPWSKQ